MLLTHSTGADREFVRGRVRRFSLGHACASAMWVLGEGSLQQPPRVCVYLIVNKCTVVCGMMVLVLDFALKIL